MRSSYQSLDSYEPIAADKIGQAWQIQASEIVTKNADTTPWYWTSTHSISLLEFWRSLEPEARMVLVYVSPAQALDYYRQENTETEQPDGAGLTSYIREWHDYHACLLRYYSENQSSCVLVNASNLFAAPEDFANLLHEKFGLSLPSSLDLPSGTSDTPAWTEFVAAGLITDSNEVATIYSELENMADLTASQEAIGAFNSDQAWAEFSALHAESEKLREENAKLSLDAKAAKRETELLALQLQQVQNELEQLFISGSKPAVTGQPLRSSDHNGKSGFEIDLREYVMGDNWHEAEQDGRWTGPGNHTTLQLPDLSPGRYVLQFTIVSSLARRIFDGVKVQIDEKDLNCNVKYKANLKGLFAPIRRARAKIQKKIFPYPAEFSARIHIADTQNSNPPTLKIYTPETMSPEVFGSGDKRLLGVKISSLTIKPE